MIINKAVVERLYIVTRRKSFSSFNCIWSTYYLCGGIIDVVAPLQFIIYVKHVFGTFNNNFFAYNQKPGLLTLLSSVVMLISPVSALLRWDFVCKFRVIERYTLWAKGHYTVMHVYGVVHKRPSYCNRRIGDLRSLVSVLSCVAMDCPTECSGCSGVPDDTPVPRECPG